MSQLAWVSLATLIVFCFHPHRGLWRAQRRGLVGLASREAASLRGNPGWKVLAGPRSSHVMPHCAFLGRTLPQGPLRRHVTAGHPSSPAACDEVMGWGPRDPLQIGWGFPQLAWEWPKDEKEEMILLLNVQPTAASLDAEWPTCRETKGDKRRYGKETDKDLIGRVPQFLH